MMIVKIIYQNGKLTIANILSRLQPWSITCSRMDNMESIWRSNNESIVPFAFMKESIIYRRKKDYGLSSFIVGNSYVGLHGVGDVIAWLADSQARHLGIGCRKAGISHRQRLCVNLIRIIIHPLKMTNIQYFSLFLFKWSRWGSFKMENDMKIIIIARLPSYERSWESIIDE